MQTGTLFLTILRSSLRPATLLKKRLWYKCFPVNFAKISKNTIFYRTPTVAAFEHEKKELKELSKLVFHIYKYINLSFTQISSSNIRYYIEFIQKMKTCTTGKKHKSNRWKEFLKIVFLNFLNRKIYHKLQQYPLKVSYWKCYS